MNLLCQWTEFPIPATARLSLSPSCQLWCLDMQTECNGRLSQVSHTHSLTHQILSPSASDTSTACRLSCFRAPSPVAPPAVLMATVQPATAPNQCSSPARVRIPGKPADTQVFRGQWQSQIAMQEKMQYMMNTTRMLRMGGTSEEKLISSSHTFFFDLKAYNRHFQATRGACFCFCPYRFAGCGESC